LISLCEQREEIIFLLIFFVLLAAVPSLAARAPAAGSPCTVLDEHPWDILNQAVRIVVIARIEDYVFILVWFDLDEPPVLFQVQREYFEQGGFERRHSVGKNIQPLRE
jgi:hypothetical protein